MKKTYIQPSVKAIELRVNQFMMESTLNVDPNKTTTTQLGREFDFNFDEE